MHKPTALLFAVALAAFTAVPVAHAEGTEGAPATPQVGAQDSTAAPQANAPASMEGSAPVTVASDAPVPAKENAWGRAHRIGLGVNYWKTIKDIDTEIDKHGFSLLGSYQYAPAWYFKAEVDFEYFPKKDFGGTESVYAPEVFLLVGSWVYAGVGAGIYHSAGGWSDSPFYALRAGIDLELIPRVHLDVNAKYLFNDWDGLKGRDVKTEADTIRLGAAIRIGL
jgi:hypothetical protein